MGEKFESREEGEEQKDVVDLLSSLTREIAEDPHGDVHLAQMVQNAKDFWLKGEHAAAYWVLEAFTMGQRDINSVANRMMGHVEGAGRVAGELEKEFTKKDGIYKKLGAITHEMGRQ